MGLFSRNKGTLTLQDLFSNEVMQHSLEALNWQFAEDDQGHAWEYIKRKSIENESMILSIVLDNFEKFTFGDYRYNVKSNRIERNSSKIKPKRKYHPDFKVSSVFKQILKPIHKPKGIVYRVD